MDLSKPCKKCGSTDRNNSGKCRPCVAARSAAHYAADREAILARQIAYQAAHHREVAANYAARTSDRKKRGLCVRCGEPAKTDRTLCLDCGNKDTARKVKRQQTHLPTRLARNLRIRLYEALKNGQKAGSAVRDLGCTIAELKVYLELKFQPGMTWENHNKKGWHIDHVKPLASFDLTDR